MSKEPIAWAIKFEYSSLDLVALTKVDACYYYGKTEFGSRTHGLTKTLLGWFPTKDIAGDAITRLRAAIDSVQENFDRAEQMRKLAVEARRIAVENAVSKAHGRSDFNKLIGA